MNNIPFVMLSLVFFLIYPKAEDNLIIIPWYLIIIINMPNGENKLGLGYYSCSIDLKDVLQ